MLLLLLYKMLFNFFFFEKQKTIVAVYLLLPYRSLAKKGEFYGLVIATITRSLDGIRPQPLASNSYGEKRAALFTQKWFDAISWRTFISLSMRVARRSCIFWTSTVKMSSTTILIVMVKCIVVGWTEHSCTSLNLTCLMKGSENIYRQLSRSNHLFYKCTPFWENLFDNMKLGFW